LVQILKHFFHQQEKILIENVSSFYGMPLMIPKVIHEKCSGCGTCRLACTLENFSIVQPSRALLRIQGRFPAPGDYRIHFCNQCGECADICPMEAIVEESGVYRVDESLCTGCMTCVDICPEGVMMAASGSDYPIKCNQCGACARICPRDAIIIPGMVTAKL
jgi:carbon-monoxide dehydrogenase iron sulfur subunit